MDTIRKVTPIVARLFLGLVFTVFGLNFFLHFLPMPAMPPAAGAFMGALLATGYLFPLLKTIEVAAGILLLSGRFVPLALTLLAPIVVNILGFHLFVERGGLGVPLAVAVAGVYLAVVNRQAFAPLLRARAHAPAEVPGPVRAAARLAT